MSVEKQLNNLFDSCLNILRSDAIVGDGALRTMGYLLVLKMIEQKFDEMGLNTYNYRLEDKYENSDTLLPQLLNFARFSNMVLSKEDDLPRRMKMLWDGILSVHPDTSRIFKTGKGFDIVNQSTYKRLIDKFASFDFEHLDRDILGHAYENMIKHAMVGKVLGQFFTPTLMKNLMIKIANPRLFEDGTCETVYDPTMGTGGFLISTLRHFMKQGIQMNWDFIRNEGIGGKEIHSDTYQLSVSNMMICSGGFCNSLEFGDSIRNPTLKKFDVILANPPFGINGLKYDEIKHDKKDEYIPIKTDNAVSLFLQTVIYMLKENGRCAIVLPDGQDLFSKSGAYVLIRQYLMYACDLQKVIYVNGGAFENTSIKTCILYFIKKNHQCIKVHINEKKKKDNRTYEFVSAFETKKVAFYETKIVGDELIENLLLEVPMEKLETNSYSLNYSEYLKKTNKDVVEGVVWKTLGDVCQIEKGSLQSSKNNIGEYTFITASDDYKTHNTYTHDCECSLLVGGAEGSLAKSHYYNGKFIASDLVFILRNKETNPTPINHKYLYYYLNFNRDKHINDVSICCGTPKKSISLERCSKIQIPIPSLETQKEIVEYLDFLYDSNKTSETKIQELKRMNHYCLEHQKKYGDNSMKTLGEVCEIEYGKRITQKKDEGTEYPAYGGGDIMSYRVNNFNRDGITYKIARDGLSRHNCVLKIYGKLFLNDTALTLKPLYNTHLTECYLGELLLKMKEEIYDNCTHGTGQLHIDLEKLMKLQIPIPSLEIQKEIVEYCEHNDRLIAELEQDIETNKENAKSFLGKILKPKKKTFKVVICKKE
jgi:type I restriction-modification system DNA methylase subunit